MYGSEYLSIWKCETGNMLSNFVSVIVKKSSTPIKSTFRSTNLFGKELILRLIIIILFVFSILVFLSMERQSLALMVLSHQSNKSLLGPF